MVVALCGSTALSEEVKSTFPKARLSLDGRVAFIDKLPEIQLEAVDVNQYRPRKPKLFLADMDSTMIGQECIDELAELAGVGLQVKEVTEKAMRGELDFNQSLIARLSLLKGLSREIVENCLETKITVNKGAKKLITGLKAKGVYTVLVSGGFTDFADVIGNELGFDRVVANQLVYDDNCLTGDVAGEIVSADTKCSILKDERKRLNISPDEVVAIGDGANDIEMLKEAGMGIAYRAKPKTQAHADFIMNYAELDSLLDVLFIEKI